MAINAEYIGREYPAPEPYEVTRGKIREFAEAINDPNPVYVDRAAAEAAGYPDVIAPPTFPVILGMAGSAYAVADPELGVDFSRVVHGDQSFHYSRPLRAGDVLTAVTRITDVKTLGGNGMLTLETVATAADGEHVVTAGMMLVVRGE
ncbi:MaoC family dehydratase N-terminal domain-containing protein [Nocardiopsis sp. EMB25]|uniref:MaoC family dehydratase N-terminal domain-containing protein n=1 Tax=Nocardiopsis TaxID=2013 RepID=UPI0004773D93|nr:MULTISPECIES: MaoC family dehydratase N-terminal domain-containing protein [Nocardiopsis]MCY9787488.1 MaoC family dehydratase N-terminal domain-containing protein [Nocardiopsis sp. EMB25]